MNILIVTRPLSRPWNEGGKNLAYGLAKNITNHKIHILVRNDFKERLSKNIVAHKIYPSEKRYNVSFFEKLKLFLFLLKFNGADLYHFIYTPEPYSVIFNNFLLKVKRKKGIYTTPTQMKNFNFLKNFIFYDKMVVISNYTKNLLESNGFNNVVKINTGIDVNYYFPYEKDPKLLNKFNLYNKKIIMFPFDLEKNKGSREVFKLICDLEKFKDLFFIFSYRTNNSRISEEKFLRKKLMKKGLLNRVLFFRDPKDVRVLINISDVVVYPTKFVYKKHEIPMILMESMSMGKPIIMWDVPPFNEVINSDEGIKVKSYDEIKIKVIELIYNDAYIKKISKYARKRILKDFNILNTAQNYYRLYNQELLS